MKLEINAYETSSGRKEAFEFIEKQSGEASFRITKALDNLQKYGLNFLLENGTVKQIKTTKNLSFYELKVSADDTFYRFPFVIKDSMVYLLFGFKKKTNKMEQRYLKLVTKRARIF